MSPLWCFKVHLEVCCLLQLVSIGNNIQQESSNLLRPWMSMRRGCKFKFMFIAQSSSWNIFCSLFTASGQNQMKTVFSWKKRQKYGSLSQHQHHMKDGCAKTWLGTIEILANYEAADLRGANMYELKLVFFWIENQRYHIKY